MKRFSLIVLLLVIMLLLGSGTKQSGMTYPYTSDTSTEDCYLCGNGIDDLIPFYWGQNNIALLSLNTFDIKPIEINRYDRITKKLIEEYEGTVSLGGGRSKDGGFSANLLVDSDRGYADGVLDFFGDKALDIDKAAEFLCAGCLDKILPSQSIRCFGVGVIHFDTKEVRVFEKQLGGFGLGDFYVKCSLTNRYRSRMNILIFYCPIRYECLLLGIQKQMISDENIRKHIETITLR